MFRDHTKFNLTREDAGRFTLRRLALKRFGLGYPPRKDKETSIGDAINWEWIVKCAEQGEYHVIIVSRDPDYGVTFGGKAYISDWLARISWERVGKKSQVILTSKLTEAFKRVSVRLSKEEEQVEEELVEQSNKEASNLALREELSRTSCIQQRRFPHS